MIWEAFSDNGKNTMKDVLCLILYIYGDEDGGKTMRKVNKES